MPPPPPAAPLPTIFLSAQVVLKSARAKRLDELVAAADDVRNKMKINDWSAIQSLFDEVNRRMERVVKADGAPGAPRAYVKLLVELDDFLAETLANKEVKKKMSATNARALNTMRQRLKKHVPGFAEQMAKFRANPESESEEEEEEAPAKGGRKRRGGDAGAEGEGSEGEGSDGEFTEAAAPRKKDKLLTMDPKEITHELVAKKLKELISQRGRRSTDKREQVEMLTFLIGVSRSPPQRFEVLAQLVSSLFDLNPSLSAHMKMPLWRTCVGHVLEMMALLKEHPYMTVDDTIAEEIEERPEGAPEPGAPVRVWGNIVAFVERLDDEMFKSLQARCFLRFVLHVSEGGSPGLWGAFLGERALRLPRTLGART